MQIKTMRYHYTPIGMANIWNTDDTKHCQGCEATGTLMYCFWECEVVELLWKTVLWFLAKLNVLLPYDPAIILLGIYPKELKIYVHTKICTQMFIAALFIVAKTWKQPRCPSVAEE